jgi:hypothetical protein
MNDTGNFTGPQAPVAFQRVRETGANYVRLWIFWRLVAPTDPALTGDPRDPNNPTYQWGTADWQIDNALKKDLTPIVTVFDAPLWAEGNHSPLWWPGSRQPNPSAFGDFAHAVATHYQGRVRRWEVWNEPNLNRFLSPQEVNGRLVAHNLYRRLVNEFAAAAHAVDPTNVVIAGVQSPVGRAGLATAPLRFMRAMLCLNSRLRPVCRRRSHLDAWSHHPYTTGGPTHHASGADDVAIGDLPEMRRVLLAAKRYRRVVSPGTPAFLVTEFSWDTNPPDTEAVPLLLHRRWVAEALYRMWQARVSYVTWFKVRDNPFPGSREQSGLWFNGGATTAEGYPDLAADLPKPSLQAFRFPFVALPRSGTVVWGRMPGTAPGRVVVERRRRGGALRRLILLETDRFGVFGHRFRTSMRRASLRARIQGTADASAPFTVKRTRDIPYPPFG